MEPTPARPPEGRRFAYVAAAGALVVVAVVVLLTALSGTDTSASPGGAPVAATATAEIPIGGMTCTGCVMAIEDAVAAIPGVAKVTVSLPDKMATVSYDADRVTVGRVVQTIEALGYTAEVPAGDPSGPGGAGGI